MSVRMVMLKNMVNSSVSVKDPSLGVNRTWHKRGQTLPIPYDTVELMLWENGFKHLIDSGILYIENMQDKKDLGLESADAIEPENIIALSTIQMENLLKNTPITVFKKEVANLPKVQVDNLIEYAVENKIIDPVKSSFLKELTGKDIMVSVSRKEEREAEERAEKAKGRHD